MSLLEIEKKLSHLKKNINEDKFIFDFLLAFGQPKATINRLKKGDYNQSKKLNQLLWKKKIFYHVTEANEDVHDIIDELSKSEDVINHNIRFIIVTDFNNFLSLDLKTRDTLDINILEIDKNTHFFLPLTGQEKAEHFEENLADIKAADKMAKLFDLIIRDNPQNFKTGREKHGLNIFFTRLLFCFFAEDAEVFEKSLFTRSVKSYTDPSGEDLNIFFNKLFSVLKSKNKSSHAEYLKYFPYVNGGLFKNTYHTPKFTKESRQLIIDAGSLDWNSINPDILGSMMQAIVQQGVRQEIGMHYTSVKNILKIIKPLFLDELNQEDFKVIGEPDAMNSSERRWIQVQKTLNPQSGPHVERVGLAKEMESWVYPLHFIDFETSAVALPFNTGRHPYEQVAFQFSHHICYSDGTIEHASEYINTTPGKFPNFEFVSALKKALEKDEGTIFRFATHENSILNSIKDQLEDSNYSDKHNLIDFIKTITTPRKDDPNPWVASRPMVDLRVVILDYYYNSLTKGSNSIKAVLPAVLNSCDFLKNKYTNPISKINITSLNFEGHHTWIQFKDQQVTNPYSLLPPIFIEQSQEQLDQFISGLDKISDGGAALTAYSKLQFVDMSDEERDSIKRSLLKYCELDTLAMVMIYEHLKTLI